MACGTKTRCPGKFVRVCVLAQALVCEVVSLTRMPLHVIMHHGCEVRTCNHRLHPTDTVLDYEGVRVALEIIIRDCSRDLVVTRLALPKSRVAFQADGNGALGANDVVALALALLALL